MTAYPSVRCTISGLFLSSTPSVPLFFHTQLSYLLLLLGRSSLDSRDTAHRLARCRSPMGAQVGAPQPQWPSPEASSNPNTTPPTLARRLAHLFLGNRLGSFWWSTRLSPPPLSPPLSPFPSLLPSRPTSSSSSSCLLVQPRSATSSLAHSPAR